MEDPAGPAPAGERGDAVMVLSVWTHGAPGGFVARITMSGAGHDASVRTVAGRQELHAVVDAWLDALHDGASTATPRP